MSAIKKEIAIIFIQTEILSNLHGVCRNHEEVATTTMIVPNHGLLLGLQQANNYLVHIDQLHV